MIKSIIGFLLVAAVLVLGAEKGPKDPAWKPTPLMKTVEPDTAKAGDEITVTGENLQKALVGGVFLTDGKNDTKLVVTEQTETTIKAKIPDKAKAGRLRLMVLTTGAEPQFLEQPVAVSIE